MPQTLLTPAAFESPQKPVEISEESPKTRRRLFKVKRAAPVPVATELEPKVAKELEPVAKRGRGRPRKIRTPEELEALETESFAKAQRRVIKEIRRKNRERETDEARVAKNRQKLRRHEQTKERDLETKKHRIAVLQKRRSVLARLQETAAVAEAKYLEKQAAVEAYIAKFALSA
jgi:hypothetical protein